jgi:hypothetical protein
MALLRRAHQEIIASHLPKFQLVKLLRAQAPRNEMMMTRDRWETCPSIYTTSRLWDGSASPCSVSLWLHTWDSAPCNVSMLLPSDPPLFISAGVVPLSRSKSGSKLMWVSTDAWVTLWAQSSDGSQASRLGYWLGLYALFGVFTAAGLISAV